MKKFLFLLLSFATLVLAKDSLFEFGIAGGSILFPDYIGSKSTQTLTLPFPYMIYRGEYLNIDKEGISGKLFDIQDLELNLSLGGSLPANSDNSHSREGMPDLNFTFEFGPKIVYRFFNHNKASLYFELPVRAVFSTNLKSIDSQGVITTPLIKYELDYGNLECTLKTGVMFADKEYHSYFYEVKQEYATPLRPQYKAKEGYSGYMNRIGISYKEAQWRFGAFATYYGLKEAVFENSPLVETKEAFFSGISLAYIFYEID